MLTITMGGELDSSQNSWGKAQSFHHLRNSSVRRSTKRKVPDADLQAGTGSLRAVPSRAPTPLSKEGLRHPAVVPGWARPRAGRGGKARGRPNRSGGTGEAGATLTVVARFAFRLSRADLREKQWIQRVSLRLRGMSRRRWMRGLKTSVTASFAKGLDNKRVEKARLACHTTTRCLWP